MQRPRAEGLNMRSERCCRDRCRRRTDDDPYKVDSRRRAKEIFSECNGERKTVRTVVLR